MAGFTSAHALWWTTMLIALFKLHHSIAGSVEVLFGVFSGTGATGGTSCASCYSQ